MSMGHPYRTSQPADVCHGDQTHDRAVTQDQRDPQRAVYQTGQDNRDHHEWIRRDHSQIDGGPTSNVNAVHPRATTHLIEAIYRTGTGDGGEPESMAQQGKAAESQPPIDRKPQPRTHWFWAQGQQQSGCCRESCIYQHCDAKKVP